MPREWDEDTIYLQIDTEGFIGKYVSTQTTENALSKIKAFCGISIALRLLKVERTYHPATPKMHIIIHKQATESWCHDVSDEISDDISRTISNLTLNDLGLRVIVWVNSYRLEHTSQYFEA